MKAKQITIWAIVVLIMLALALAAVGCFGSGAPGTTANPTATTIPGQTTTSIGTSTSVSTTTTTGGNPELSTFKSKDPFIQQAQPVVASTSTSAGGGGVTPTTLRTPSTIIFRPPSTGTTSRGSGGSTTTTVAGGSTTSASTTSTTAPHIHTLKILSASQVGGSPAVTFQVDGSVYKDKHAGDVVSTSWGQIKVLEVSLSSKVVTLLHGSETLVLSVGQVVYQ